MKQTVPGQRQLLGTRSYMGGEIVYRYYQDPDGNVWKLCDWIGSKPEPLDAEDVAYIANLLAERRTGGTEEVQP